MNNQKTKTLYEIVERYDQHPDATLDFFSNRKCDVCCYFHGRASSKVNKPVANLRLLEDRTEMIKVCDQHLKELKDAGEV